jgi:hypothetical protein
MKHIILSGLALGLFVSAAAAQGLGLTVRLHGGLDGLGSIDALNDGIASTNTYFSDEGTWVADAQGSETAGATRWAPWLRLEELNNRPDMGIVVEKMFQLSPYTRLFMGLDAAAGNISSSALFEFQPPNSNLEGSVWFDEHIAVSNIQFTSRYSVKDPVLPLFAHAGLSLGLGQIEATADYINLGTSFSELDPLYGEMAPTHTITGSFDGDALTARLFVGFEYEMGASVFQLDMGYNHMDFGELDGSTVVAFRDPNGDMIPVDIVLNEAGDPLSTRYEYASLISLSLQNARLDAIWELVTGLPADDSALILEDPEGFYNLPEAKAIDYDMSGGYVRLSVGYRF